MSICVKMYQYTGVVDGIIFSIKSKEKDINALYLHREDIEMIKNEVIGRIHLFSLEIFYQIYSSVNCCIQLKRIEYSAENTCKH